MLFILIFTSFFSTFQYIFIGLVSKWDMKDFSILHNILHFLNSLVIFKSIHIDLFLNLKGLIYIGFYLFVYLF